ncbi:MAG: asparaginase [Planctomycetes bacterium]|nr:asparaginase [Planctomycetota bacterium]
MNPVLLEIWRGNVLESAHRGRYAVVSDGKIVARDGDVDDVTFLRSAAKPFQATAVLQTGAREAYGLTDEEVAVIAGSHYGEEVHVRAVRSILEKAGLETAHLRCGTHPPFPTAKPAPRSVTALHNNCSGKHAGMLAAAKRLKAPLDRYLDFDHPVQRANLRMVARFAGVRPSTIQMAIDGCGAPTFGMPLTAIARAFARLADSSMEVTRAMMAHPHMVGHPCEELMKAAPGRLVAKLGAEGVYGVGVVGRGIGLALKIDDGSSRPLLPIVLALMRMLGLFEGKAEASLKALAKDKLLNHAGKVVGRIRVRLSRTALSERKPS